MATEVRAGEAGVLRAALGVVLALEGIDARVRLFLWSGGVTDITVPVLGTQRVAGGMQVVVMFLSDQPESGVVLGPLDGNLSWRRTALPAWQDRIQPTIAAVIEGAQHGQGTATHKPGFFAYPDDTGGLLACGCVALADGRVFLLPADATAPAFVFDPLTLALHRVPWQGQADQSFAGGVLLADGQVLLVPYGMAVPLLVVDPTPGSLTTCEVADLPGGWRSGTLLPDGRALLFPNQYSLDLAAVYDPDSNTLSTIAELGALGLYGVGQDFTGGCALPDGRVLFAPGSMRDLVLWDPGRGVGLGRDVVLSGWWNKG